MAAKLRIAVCFDLQFARVLGLNSFLSKIYGTGQTSTAAFFLCGPCGAHNWYHWDGMSAKLTAKAGRCKASKQIGENSFIQWRRKISARTRTFFSADCEQPERIFAQLPDMIWTGYIASTEGPSWVFRTLLTNHRPPGSFIRRAAMGNAGRAFVLDAPLVSIVGSASICSDPRVLAVQSSSDSAVFLHWG